MSERIEYLEELIYRDNDSIYFNAEIDSYNMERLMKLSREIVDENVGRYKLYIHSGGGYTSLALRFSDFVRLMIIPKIPKAECIILGSCYSASVDILCSFPIRKGTANSFMLLHKSKTEFDLTYTDEIEESLRHSSLRSEYSANIQSNATKLSIDKINQLHNESKYLTMKECLELGFIQEIL